MSDQAFTDPRAVSSMEAEHLPLWRAFLRVIAHLLVPGVRLMDFGCNGGGLLFFLCGRNPEGVAHARPSIAVGVDLDTAPMRSLLAAAAEENGGRHPLVFTTCSPARLPGQFDLVVSHEVAYLLPDPESTFAEIHAALVPGGHFCFATGCHTENPLFPRWKRSLASEGVAAFERSIGDYEAALRASGYEDITRSRLLLTPAEYDAWVERRGSSAPNPSWFPGAAAERQYYTQLGKAVLTGRKS